MLRIAPRPPALPAFLAALGLTLALALAASAVAPRDARAEMIGGNPGPAYNFVCPNSDGKPPLDCYFDAVAHLYTMCKHVKSIEIIEFGYEHATEGTNGAKSESCLVKMKLNMTRPYQAALKAAAQFKASKAVDGLRKLNELWLDALTGLAWKTGESDDAYKARTMRPYEAFASGIVEVQTAIQLAEAEAKAKASAKAHPAKPAAKGAKPAGKGEKPATTASAPQPKSTN